MNRDSDIMKAILLRLLFEAVPADDFASEEEYPSPQSPPPWPPSLATDHGLAPSPGADPNAVFDPGDHPVVQTQFEALVKRRLSQDIALHPPLFPWEQGLQDYPDHLQADPDFNQVWFAHLRNLDIPVRLPETVLTELFSHCQRAAQQTQQLGRQLIEAVESLFPDQPQTLAYVAALVARPNARSAAATLVGPVNYDTASTQQQIALTMLAARSIFEALSLTVSPLTPSASRAWLTASGPLSVTVALLGEGIFEVRTELPEPGAVVLTGLADVLHSDRTSPGDLILQISHPHPHTPYTLEVSLGDGTPPLRFQITVEA